MESTAPNHLSELVAILFRAGRVVPAEKLAAHFAVAAHELSLLADEANATLAPLGLQITFAAGGYRLTTSADSYDAVRSFFTEMRDSGLSAQALEVLAIIAYRQPVTRTDVEQVRQVNSESPLHSLLQRRLIKVKGRSDLPGRPFVYATTDRFLEVFGLGSLEDLPKVELELPEQPLQPSLQL
jgi:segregation and condensation protein B